jgi:hypothetical protein
VLRGRDVALERVRLVLDHAHVELVNPQRVVDAPPAGTVDEAAMHEHDVLHIGHESTSLVVTDATVLAARRARMRHMTALVAPGYVSQRRQSQHSPCKRVRDHVVEQPAREAGVRDHAVGAAAQPRSHGAGSAGRLLELVSQGSRSW